MVRECLCMPQVLSACESGDSKGGRQSHKTAVAAGACLTAVCSAASSLLSTSPDSKTALPICSSLAQVDSDTRSPMECACTYAASLARRTRDVRLVRDVRHAGHHRRAHTQFV